MAINKALPKISEKKNCTQHLGIYVKKIKTNRRDAVDKRLGMQTDFRRFQYLCAVVYCLFFVTRKVLRFTFEFTF